jgi:hypothetical protein
MHRLTTLLILFAFVFTNGPAIASAMCHHGSANAHQAALLNSDADVSIAAQDEESLARAASKKTILGDAAGPLLSGFILPADPVSPAPRPAGAKISHPRNPAGLQGRSVPPLLEPPLA